MRILRDIPFNSSIIITVATVSKSLSSVRCSLVPGCSRMQSPGLVVSWPLWFQCCSFPCQICRNNILRWYFEIFKIAKTVQSHIVSRILDQRFVLQIFSLRFSQTYTLAFWAQEKLSITSLDPIKVQTINKRNQKYWEMFFQALVEMEEFKNLDRDIEGSAKRWKKFVESEYIEREKFPQEWKSKTALQRLCMLRALRPDRMMYAIE